jgi:L-ascorbate metabolism protein UlaG (beta-lactamase superfamily)
MLINGLGLVILIVLAVTVFMYTAPQIGQKPEGSDLARVSKSTNYQDQEFINLTTTETASFGELMGTLPEFIRSKNGKPNKPLQVRFGQNQQAALDSLCYVTWYGHSAFQLEMEGKRILIDPMFGASPSPIPFGTKRFDYEKPIPVDDIQDIDAVILSHDHYDHLDYPTILALKDKVKHFFVPLGVGSHLKKWGVPPERITELDWWQRAELDGIELIACPARHFSGRGFSDRNATQWSSWVIKSSYHNLYFSGDSGYGAHFKEIGEKYGPFKLAMMECGQYNEAWEAIHMMPEQSVQAGLDVNAELVMPIHWAAFKLSIHEWTDPIIRFRNESERMRLPIISPVIGERFCLGQNYPREVWWSAL